MAVISTVQLFDEFFADKSDVVVRKVRSQVDRPEVYAFEAKIGKQLVDMNVDELFEMIQTFNYSRGQDIGSDKAELSYSTYAHIASVYRNIFNYYIDNHEVIRNPFNDKRMKGTAAAERLSQVKERFSWSNVEFTIRKIHTKYEPELANYLECIVLLYYNGFAKAEEIVNLSEDMIDFKTKEVRLPGRTIKLSDRCFELLTYVHKMTEMKTYRTAFAMVCWRDKYFKYPIRRSQLDEFDNRTPEDLAIKINHKILIEIKRELSIDINYRLLYLLGFYNSLEREYGVERARELVLSVRDSEATELLSKSARMYGVVGDNITNLKRSLRPFI